MRLWDGKRGQTTAVIPVETGIQTSYLPNLGSFFRRNDNQRIRLAAVRKVRNHLKIWLTYQKETGLSTQSLAAVLHKERDLYVAECPEVGTVSQGHTIEEALANLQEATELYLEEFSLKEITRPLLTTFEVAIHS